MSKYELLEAIEKSRTRTNQLSTHQQEVAQKSFSEFPLAHKLLENITKKGYTLTTPIQAGAIPVILEGRDIIGIANTGTGKTAAFLVPLIDIAIRKPHAQTLIITPTRELAVQVYKELRGFSEGLGVFSVLCIGGDNMRRQKQELRNNPRFVIGTPGRLKDLIESRGLFLNRFTSVVLDEADRMVDIGFINDIKYFIQLLPRQRQSLFFSATISERVKEIIARFVTNPVTVSVKTQEAAENVHQDIISVKDKSQKLDLLHDLLAREDVKKVVIFGRTKWGVQKLTNELMLRGFKAGVIHGNKRQSQRQRTLDEFKRDKIQILLATDVASRGLDITDVTHVINYDMPATVDDYIHRIGRTGRADKKGIALTFVE